jgi:DNA primase
LHQHQRQQTTRNCGGQSRRCVVATLEDLELANRLASEALPGRADALLPQTGQLLLELERYVRQRAEAEGVPCSDVRFTQREVRESLGWSDRSLRRHLGRLVQVEYLVVYRAGRGNQRVYQLLYDSQAVDGRAHLLGLIDVDQLRKAQKPGLEDPRSVAIATPHEERNGQMKTRTGTPSPPTCPRNRRPAKRT